MKNTGGLILCGGRSSRMGQDKAALRLPTGNSLQRALGYMRQVAAGPLVVSLAADAPVPDLPEGVQAVRDGQKEQGPLWGLLEGFRAMAGSAERLLVMPVDMPFYTPQWMEMLVTGLEGHRACLFRWEGFTNALTAAYRLELLPKLERLVLEERWRPMFLSEGEPTRIITVEEHWREGQGPPPLMDMDTPEDYRRVLAFEGIGAPEEAPVSVELPPSSMGSGVLHLFAASAEDVLRGIAALYPEWREVCRNGTATLLDLTNGGEWVAGRENPVSETRLRLLLEGLDT